MKTDAPIFIVGTPRSGTTLTAKILGHHSRIFMPGETHFFDDIYSRRSELGRPENVEARRKILGRLLTLYGRFNEPEDQKRIDILVDKHRFKEKVFQNSHSYLAMLNLFMELQVEYAGKKRWGNNAPRDIFNIKEILEFYKDAKIIVCVRDIRDFLLSYKGKWRATSEEEVERLKKLYHPIVTSLLWKSSMKLIPSIKKLVPAENFFILKYEYLVEEPEKAVRQLCTFLDERFESEMLGVTSANSSHGEAQPGIFSSSVSKWKKLLSKEEIAIAQKIAGREMQLLDYKIEKTSANSLSLLSIYFSAPFALWRGLTANKEKRGPLFPYLLKRAQGLLK